MSKAAVSVVIPVKNEADKIEHCLEAVQAQSLEPYEVIVVNGHSNDETIQRIKKFPVKLLYEDHHSRGGARQVGVEGSKGEYVAFTDASCIPNPNWLEACLRNSIRVSQVLAGQWYIWMMVSRQNRSTSPSQPFLAAPIPSRVAISKRKER